MKRTILALLLLCLFLFSVACQNPGANDSQGGTPPLPSEAPVLPPIEETPTITPSASGETILFTDSFGTEVALPETLLHIAPGNAEAQAVLFSIAPEKLAGWIAPPGEEATAYLDPAYMALPNLSEPDGGVNLAAAIDAGAQAILIMGDRNNTYLRPAGEELPVFFIECTLETFAEAYRTLGGLFGMEESAEDGVAYIASAIELLQTYAGSIPEGEYKKVFLASGNDGLTPLDSPVLPLGGALNAVAAEKAGAPVTMDALEELGANAIFTSSDEVFQLLSSGAQGWSELELVQMGLYYEAPTAIFNWLSGDTTANKLIGAKWLGNILYPELYNYLMVEEIKLHYDFFWHCQLSDAQAEALLQNSTLKPIG